jgi:alginate O-acetyltransferase complex protein AlgI
VQFTSLLGLMFIALAATIFHLVPARFKALVLVIASYSFYATVDVGMLPALIIATVTCFYAAITVENRRDGGKGGYKVLILSVCLLILYLCFFKIRGLLENSILVPLGVSYYTFRLLSYLLDIHWGKIKAERDIVRFAAYVSFFPHLVAGPIQRAEEFFPQISIQGHVASPRIFSGVIRIVNGLFKKLVIADSLALLTSYGFIHAGEDSSLPSILAFYLFPLQLLMDFSALTDMAIGIGLLFGFESPENFDRPFLAPNISEFWRRWHMSLTSWLRDYVFMPTRMAIRNWGNTGLIVALTINMMLIALWHGFRSSFLTFGVIHSIYLIVDVLSLQYRKRYYKKHLLAAGVAALIGPIFTYHLIAIGNVFFRAATFGDGYRLLLGLFSGFENFDSHIAGVAVDNKAWIAIPLSGLAILGDAWLKRLPPSLHAIRPRWLSWAAGINALIVCLFVLMLLAAGKQEISPFLYENF